MTADDVPVLIGDALVNEGLDILERTLGQLQAPAAAHQRQA